MLKVSATLRVSTSALSLAEMEETLGPADEGYSIGEKFSRGRKKRSISMWRLRGKDTEFGDVEGCITSLLDYVRANREGFERLADDGAVIDIFVRLKSDNGQGGTTFSPTFLSFLADTGVAITFDVDA